MLLQEKTIIKQENFTCVFHFITQNIKEKCNQRSRCNKINQFLLPVKDILNWNWHFLSFFFFFFFLLQACDNEGYNSSQTASRHWLDSFEGTRRFTHHCFCTFSGNVHRVESANKIWTIHLTVVLSLQGSQEGVQGFLDQTLRTALSRLTLVCVVLSPAFPQREVYGKTHNSALGY